MKSLYSVPKTTVLEQEASLKEIFWKYKLISYSDLKYFISELQYIHHTIQNLTEDGSWT